MKNDYFNLKQIQKLKFSAICSDSRKVIPQALFVALKGYQGDGHLYLKSAIQKGASALLVENKDALKGLCFSGPVGVVKNTKIALPVLLNSFYNHPSEKMFCVGVTGTNGKSTVAHIMAFLFTRLGWRTGLVGSIVNRFEEWEEKSSLTTPGNVYLHGLLHHFCQKGAQAVVMEVSSIGLDQQRTAGVAFNLAVWTNFSQDHLDYHASLSDYFKAKKKLFSPSLNHSQNSHFRAIINLDDPYGLKLLKEINPLCVPPALTQGPHFQLSKTDDQKDNTQKQKGFSYKILSSDLSGSHFQVHFNGQTEQGFLPMIGSYNVSNAVASLCGVCSAGFSLNKAVKYLKDFPGVPGRLQKVWPLAAGPQAGALQAGLQPLVFVDYAHTPSALMAVLSFLKQNKKPKGRLYTVFGCGGKRDQSKRPLMGRSVERFSDKIFLTSDNPRGEEPEQIIEDSLKGITHKTKVVVEADRRCAIEKALKQAQREDIVLIAGKGHETEQIIKDKKYHFSDSHIVWEYYRSS